MPPSHSADYGIILTVLAVAMMLQGCRLSALVGLTVMEVTVGAKLHLGEYIVRISTQKTAGTSGPASVVLNAYQHAMFGRLCAIKARLGLETERVFTTHHGSEPSSEFLFGAVNKFITLRLGRATKLTCNHVRKTLESSVYLSGDSSREVQDGVTQFLMHGKAVSDLHYSFRTDGRLGARSERSRPGDPVPATRARHRSGDNRTQDTASVPAR